MRGYGMSIDEIRLKFDYTRVYSWWWQSGVGYKRAGELTNRNIEERRDEQKRQIDKCIRG